MSSISDTIMKKRVGYFVLALLIGGLFSCASPRPYYQTREGKKKQDYYNRIQYGTQKKY
jgi:hypothetical protein